MYSSFSDVIVSLDVDACVSRIRTYVDLISRILAEMNNKLFITEEERNEYRKRFSRLITEIEWNLNVLESYGINVSRCRAMLGVIKMSIADAIMSDVSLMLSFTVIFKRVKNFLRELEHAVRERSI